MKTVEKVFKVKATDDIVLGLVEECEGDGRGLGDKCEA